MGHLFFSGIVAQKVGMQFLNKFKRWLTVVNNLSDIHLQVLLWSYDTASISFVPL